MLTKEIRAQVREDAEFGEALDDIVRNSEKKLLVLKIQRIVHVLNVIRVNYPKEIYDQYYHLYGAVLDVFYKK